VAALDTVFIFPTPVLETIIGGVADVAAEDRKLEVLLNGLAVEPDDMVVPLEILLVDTVDVDNVDPL